MSPYSKTNGTWHKLFRIKRRREKCFVFPPEASTSAAMSVYELINSGIHNLIGIGVFVGIGQIVKDFAGPSVLISLVIAATTCILSGSCYTELCVRCPERAGGAYNYLFYASGELLAFTCACCSLVQHIFSVSLAARSISQNFDLLLDNAIFNATSTSVGYINLLDSHPDFIAMVLVFLMTAQIGFGFKTANPLMKLICNGISVIIVVLVVSFGLLRVDIEHWNDPKDFFPHQLQGVFSGAAICCLLLLGLDSLLSETTSSVCRRQPFQDPKNSTFTLHISILSTLIISLILFLSVSVVLSLVIDSSDLVTESPLAEGLRKAGVNWLRYIFFIGVFVALVPFASSNFVQAGELLHALASDGLVPQVVGEYSSRSGLPIGGILAHGILSSVCAIVFNLSDMLAVVVLCILVVQTLACISLINLRYQPRRTYQPNTKKERQKRRKKRKTETLSSALRNDLHLIQESTESASPLEGASSRTGQAYGTLQLRLDNSEDSDLLEEQQMTENDSSSDTDIDDVVDEYKETITVATAMQSGISNEIPTVVSAKRAAWCACALLILLIVLSLVLVHLHRYLILGNPGVIIVLCVCVSFILTLVVVLALQPREDWGLEQLQLTVPFVPWIPTLAMLLTTHLLVRVSLLPWLIFIIFIGIGLSFYGVYGIRNSTQMASMAYSPLKDEAEQVLLDSTDDDVVSAQVDVTLVSERGDAAQDASQRRVQAVDVLVIE